MEGHDRQRYKAWHRMMMIIGRGKWPKGVKRPLDSRILAECLRKGLKPLCLVSCIT